MTIARFLTDALAAWALQQPEKVRVIRARILRSESDPNDGLMIVC